ncbi:MAG: sensor histidine kinase [Actinomycetes bacterium]
MRREDLRPLALFDGLTDEQLDRLVATGEEVVFSPGQTLWTEGEPAESWWVLVEGRLDLVRLVGREETVLGRFDAPGRWAGGFRAWDPDGVYLATGRATENGRMLRVPATELRDLMRAYPLVTPIIDGLFHTARNIEAGARQRESLVTLGTLAAGLAHELNNPAAAAGRAVASLDGEVDTLLASLGRLAKGEISAAQFSALDTLRLEVRPRTGVPDPLATADQEDALSAWLRAHGVARDWVLAAPLAAAGVDVAWCERVAAVLDGESLASGLEWAASTFAVAALLTEVRESTRRVSELVAAVRSYSQLDRASLQPVDVTEGIESTLVMLAHKLRGGVTVERDYAPDVPRIEAYAGELNQVWTNLVDNAVDAMDGVGTLRISTRADGDVVVVSVQDSGPGMPAAVAARAFEAFFTTKEVGKGTGLGLDIARRIVTERHGGTITLESRPGDTVVQVRLPVRVSPRE